MRRGALKEGTMFKKGTRVSFSWTDKLTGQQKSGTGEIISDEEDGRVLVSCDPESGDARHFVIRCTVTWLTVIA